MIGKHSRKIIQQLPLIFCILNKKKSPADIRKINSNCEKQMIILMIPNEEKEGWCYFAVKKNICIITWNNSKT